MHRERRCEVQGPGKHDRAIKRGKSNCGKLRAGIITVVVRVGRESQGGRRGEDGESIGIGGARWNPSRTLVVSARNSQHVSPMVNRATVAVYTIRKFESNAPGFVDSKYQRRHCLREPSVKLQLNLTTRHPQAPTDAAQGH